MSRPTAMEILGKLISCLDAKEREEARNELRRRLTMTGYIVPPPGHFDLSRWSGAVYADESTATALASEISARNWPAPKRSVLRVEVRLSCPRCGRTNCPELIEALDDPPAPPPDADGTPGDARKETDRG